MSGTDVQNELEQVIDIIRSHLMTDLDHISRGQLEDDLKKLEQFAGQTIRERDIKRVQGLISQAIPHIYRARGFAGTDTPREFEYYQHMQQTRSIYRTIKSILGLDD